MGYTRKASSKLTKWQKGDKPLNHWFLGWYLTFRQTHWYMFPRNSSWKKTSFVDGSHLLWAAGSPLPSETLGPWGQTMDLVGDAFTGEIDKQSFTCVGYIKPMWSYSRWNINVIFSLHTPWAVAWFLVWCSNAVGKPPEIKLNYPHTWLRCKFLGFPWFGEVNEIHNLSAPYSDVAWLYHDWNPLHWLVQLPHDLFQNYNLLDMTRILGKASWHQWTYSTGVLVIPHFWWKHMEKNTCLMVFHPHW